MTVNNNNKWAINVHQTCILIALATCFVRFFSPLAVHGKINRYKIAPLDTGKLSGLPEKVTVSGMIVKKAATAMLVKVNLSGVDELNHSDWYDLAEQKAQEVITSGRFALVNDPAKTVEEDNNRFTDWYPYNFYRKRRVSKFYE